MRVLDASACVDILLATRRAAAARAALSGQALVAPSLLDVEVASALARLERAGELSAARAATALGDLCRLQIARVHHEVLLDRAWSLRRRVRVSDTFYVACAQFLDVLLVTSDARLARAGLTDVSLHLVT